MDSFQTASVTALQVLGEKFGFQLCMITRVEGDEWTVIYKNDHGYGVCEGDIFSWSDSFCSEMVKGNGPAAAPDVSKIATYTTAAINEKFTINSYLGAPLKNLDGSIFGTICCIDPRPKSDDLQEGVHLIKLIADLLSLILQLETKIDDEERRSERLQAQALTDALTGLYNRTGWIHFVDKEEGRYRRLRSPSVVLVIDLDGLKKINDEQGHAAGDELITKAGNAIQAACRAHDIVARLGGDEFAILGVNCDRQGGIALKERIAMSLENVGIEASIGMASTTRETRIEEALKLADFGMYEEKRCRALSINESAQDDCRHTAQRHQEGSK